MKSTINGVTTSFVGQHYEVTSGVATKYYFAGTSRIAMRQGATLYYLLSDHLGSTSITTDSAGSKVFEQRYKPWGETRFPTPNTGAKTPYQFTGQFSYEADFGLYFYNARWYDSLTGRFAQADSIIPGAGNSSAWDRYAYTLNNPLRYIDPSGHMPSEGCGDDGKSACAPTKQEKEDYEYWRQNNDHQKCQAGNDTYCSYGELHPVETAVGIVGGLALAGAGAAVAGATAVTVETAVTTTTVVEATNGFCGGDMCTGEVDELSRFFHSGNGSQVAAETLAKTHNAVTLSQTEAGAELTQIFGTSGYNVMRPFAEAASADWAVGASGRVDIILKLPLVHNSIWATIEYPALLVNDAVKTIVIHFIP